MLFVNISTDRIQCLVDGTETIIEHVDLEKSIARFLKAQFTMKNPQSHKVFVLNWPGSFTNIRIATLCCNMYNFLNAQILDFYSIDKLTLYKKLYQKKLIPAVGYIYIGQKKNWRRVDFSTMEQTMIQILDVDTSDGFVERLFDHQHLLANDAQFLSLSWEDESLIVNWQGNTFSVALEELNIAPAKTLEANYMMDANVTLIPTNRK